MNSMPYETEILVVGCGNVLFKDDGFGPAVIEALEKYFDKNPGKKPAEKDVMFIDAGTGGTHFIFSLPNESWKKLIVVDIVEFNAEPGTIRVFDPFEIPKGSYENAHTWPVEEPLHELSENMEVIIIGCKPQEISAPDVVMELTKPVENAIPDAIEIILKEIGV